ncbi:glycosyltransferase family 4 protein [Pedobacter arcticus]|uniref:glycosyltransferase family 4 protein n=1 Tax=Pedobacter arcticus TaxID=752140 RepID=UPI000474B1E4|nr:glycosyltransferase family 1 protein [Pedobacter arcticus]
MSNILIDLERLKYPNTGLHTFCSKLGSTLLKRKSDAQDLTFYVPAKDEYIFGHNPKYFIQKTWHKLLKPNFKQFDICHTTNQVSRYIPSSNKPKLILTIHDLNFLIEKKDQADKIKMEISKIQNNITRAQVVTTISEYVKRDIENNFDLKGKTIKVIYNGGALDLSLPANFENARDVKRPFLFTIGTVLPKKNFHVLVPMMRYNDFDLVIAGNFSCKKYVSLILELAQKWGVADRVKLLGPVSEEEKIWLYKNCSAFFFPSLAEGFGLPVIEAMSFSKPVFLSKHTSLPEIGGEVAYYLDSFDPQEMAHTLDTGLNDFENSNLHDEIFKQANKFTWEKAADEYLKVYNELIH